MKKLLTITFLSWCLLLLTPTVKAQYDTGTDDGVDVLKAYSVTIPQSPDVAAMNRYGEFPVDMSVGVPEISIPLFEIECGELTVPISISYHMGGIKVADFASSVGLGWSLNAGGSISRSVRGLPDELQYGFLKPKTWTMYTSSTGTSTYTAPWTPEQYQTVIVPSTDLQRERLFEYLEFLANPTGIKNEGGIDGQSDNYYYQAPGINGSFFYRMNRTLVQSPQTDNSISYSNNSYIITSNDGTIFTFGKGEFTSVIPNGGQSYPSAWHLTEITSADGVDKIQFSYISGNFRVVNESATESEGPAVVGGAHVPYKQEKPTLTGSSTVTTSQQFIDEIKYRGGSVKFNYSSRLDNGEYRLISIVAKDNSGRQIRKIEFTQDYFISGGTYGDSEAWKKHRLQLKGVSIYGTGDDTKPEVYEFDYFKSYDLPPYDRYNGYCGQDYWGFYNGANKSLNNMIVGPAISMIGNTNTHRANRKSSESNMRACILTQIKYPTGGYTVFTTEANRDANNTVVGGLRVSKITSYSDNGKIAFTRTYEYEDPVYLYEPKEIDYTYDMYVITGRRDVLNHRRYFYTEEPLVNVNLHRGSAVMYRKVTSYLTTDNTTGKQITYYRTPEKFNAGGIFPTMESVPWTCGNVEKEEFYATGAVNPVKIKEYGIDCTITSSQNGFISRSSVIPIFSGLLEGGPLPHDDIFSCYVAGFTSAPTGRIYVQNITETDYDLSGKELTRKKTDYNYRGDLITGLNYQGSDGEYQRLDYEYPHTIASKTSVHNTMVSRNMINKTLKTIRRAGQWDLSGGTPVTVNTSFIDYQLFNGNLIKPARIDISYNDPDVVTTEMTFLRYDSYGNVSEVTGKDGTPVVYLWGYMGRYLIAELRNVTYQQVAQYVNPETIAARTEPTAAEFRTIDNLRQQFPEASITTFKYSDHIGIVEQTDPAGITTTFTYDPKGRLSGTFDHNGMQLFEHSYGLAR